MVARLRWHLVIILGLTLVVGAGVARWAAHVGAGRGWALAAAIGFLWVASGVLAWRLSRRFLAVVDTARAIGDGDLSARVEPGRAGGDLAILAAAINDMAERIGKQLGDQKQLLAAVSHELRTPLAHLRILLETARDAGTAPAPTLIDELEREVLLLDDLVGRLLASSRLDFAQLEARPVDVGALVGEVAARAGVVCAIEIEGDPQLTADPTLLRRAIANLLDNARVHGGGATAVRVVGDADRVRVEVDDEGPGVPAERQGQVFEPFVPSAAGGLGLGMALVARIAQAHGGGAWLEPRPGGGTRAGLRLARR